MEPSGKASAETQSSGSPREYVLKQDKAAQTTGQSRCLRAMGLGVLAAALQPSIPCAPPVTAGRSSAATSPGHGGRTSLFQQKEETVRTQKPLTPVPGVPELPSVSRQSQVSFKGESPFQKHEASTGYKSTQQKAVASRLFSLVPSRPESVSVLTDLWSQETRGAGAGGRGPYMMYTFSACEKWKTSLVLGQTTLSSWRIDSREL